MNTSLRQRLVISIVHATFVACALLSAINSGHAQCLVQQIDRVEGADGVCGLSGCRFGYAVAISGDGNTAIIGAQGDNGFQGAGYVFVRQGPDWVQQGGKLTPAGGDGPAQNFGSSVAISADGNTAVVGAYGDSFSLGAAYVFVRSGTEWSQQGPKIVASGNIGQLGYFGIASAMSRDGNTMVIGAEGDNGYAGAAYVFGRANGVWTQQAKFTSINGISVTQYFGSAVAISGDGNTVAVGARGDNDFRGAAYMFVRTPLSNIWINQAGKLTPVNSTGIAQYFGCSVALSGNGNVALIGAFADNNFNGAVYNYNRFGSAWLNQQKFAPIGAAGAGRYGSAVALSDDGQTGLVGAYADNFYSGAAYKVTKMPGGGWGQPNPKILPTGASGAGTFGFTLSVSATGERAFIGAYAEGNAIGASYGFNLCGSVTVCRADFNGSTDVDVGDIFEYLNSWFAGEARADVDGQAGITVQDVFEFLNLWFAGC